MQIQNSNIEEEKFQDPEKQNINQNNKPYKTSKQALNQEFLSDSMRKKDYTPYELANKELFLFQFICKPYYKFRNTIISPFSKKTIFFNKPYGWFLASIPLITLSIIFSLINWFLYDLCPEEIPNILLVFTIALSTKNSLLTFITGIGFDQQILLHKITANILFITGLIHGLHYILTEEIVNQTYIGSAFFGCIVLASFVGVFFKFFFKGYYEVFYFLHFFFFIAAVVMGILHGSKAVIVGIVFYSVDKIICIIISEFVYKKGTKKCKVCLISEDVVSLKFDKKDAFFNYKPGQFVKIIIPKVTPFELHPFSIESSPYEKEVSIMIKVCGNWTRELKKVYLKELKKKQENQNLETQKIILGENENIPQNLEKNNKETNLNKEKISKKINLLENEICLPIIVDGPYGNSMINLDSEEYQTLLLICGGIGITPIQSYAKNLLYEIKRGRKIKKIIFIWSGRNPGFLDNGVIVDEIYQKLNFDNNKNFFEIFLHLTKNENLNFLQEKKNFSDLKKNSIYLKRPNYESHFKNLNEFCQRENIKKIGVMTCGPKRMMDSVISLCHKYDGKNKIGIRFHYETFGFLDDLF